MAKTFQWLVKGTLTQANFDNMAQAILFADAIQPAYAHAEADQFGPTIIVTSNVDSTEWGNDYILLANDSQSEVTVDVSTGKFVEGNLIAVLATTSEAQSDLRDFVTYFASSGDIHLHVGVCNTTQSQDYTPAIISNSRVLKMVSPAQVQSLGL